MVYLYNCPHRPHLRCYAALCVWAGANLRCPACRSTVTVEDTDNRRALRQDSDEVPVETLTVAPRVDAG